MSRREGSLAAWARRRLRVLLNLRSDEQGATAVMVAILSVLMLGMLGFVVDYGVVEAKRSQLQVAADAAALAIANDCSSGNTAQCRANGTGLALATQNEASAASATLDTTSRRVTVTAEGSVSFSLMHTLGIIGADLEAEATASWTPSVTSAGTVSRANVYPIALEGCQKRTELTVQPITYGLSSSSVCYGNVIAWPREAVYIGGLFSCGKERITMGERVRADIRLFSSCSVPSSPVIVALWDDPSGILIFNSYRVSEFAIFEVTQVNSSRIVGRFLPWNPNHPDIVTSTGGTTVPGSARLIG
ncbi:MAG: hypothetical protein IR160_09260 [Salinibacterium sp.]|nr:pilus assembly protein TadG-related protein [Salinibacterium sp.]MBF0672758.1 hypothetical protein [Salinibacterium sp.]